MVSSCSPQKYSALGGQGDVTSDQSDQQYTRSDQYNAEEKLRIPQVQNVLATRGSRTPSPFRTIFKGMAKGTGGFACRRQIHLNQCSVLRAS